MNTGESRQLYHGGLHNQASFFLKGNRQPIAVGSLKCIFQTWKSWQKTSSGETVRTASSKSTRIRLFSGKIVSFDLRTVCLWGWICWVIHHNKTKPAICLCHSSSETRESGVASFWKPPCLVTLSWSIYSRGVILYNEMFYLHPAAFLSFIRNPSLNSCWSQLVTVRRKACVIPAEQIELWARAWHNSDVASLRWTSQNSKINHASPHSLPALIHSFLALSVNLMPVYITPMGSSTPRVYSSFVCQWELV